MKPVSRLICNNIQKINFVPGDLLSDGIINIKFLKAYHRSIFDIIDEFNYADELNAYYFDKVELNEVEKKFIRSHINKGHANMPLNLRDDCKKFYNALISFLTQLERVWNMPLYRNKSTNINERSYTHQIVKCIFDFMLYNVKDVDVEFDGSVLLLYVILFIPPRNFY